MIFALSYKALFSDIPPQEAISSRPGVLNRGSRMTHEQGRSFSPGFGFGLSGGPVRFQVRVKSPWSAGPSSLSFVDTLLRSSCS